MCGSALRILRTAYSKTLKASLMHACNKRDAHYAARMLGPARSLRKIRAGERSAKQCRNEIS